MSQIEIRGQASFDKLDAAELAASLTGTQAITGKATGQTTFEASADTLAELPSKLNGRMSLLVKNGEIQGIALPGLLRRAEGGLRGPAPSEWRGGRTPFDQAQFVLVAANGLAEIGEGNIDGANLHTSVRGEISLPQRTAMLRLTSGPASETSDEQHAAAVLDVSGPWASAKASLEFQARREPEAGRPAPLKRHARIAARTARRPRSQVRCTMMEARREPRRDRHAAASITTATAAIIRVDTALISGVTPSRTWL